MNANDCDLSEAVLVQRICSVNKVQLTLKGKCKTYLMALHEMLDPKWEVDGKVIFQEFLFETGKKFGFETIF